MTQSILMRHRRFPFTLSGLWQRVSGWRACAETRRDLAQLDERLLEDIGLTRDLALREAGRPFWD